MISLRVSFAAASHKIFRHILGNNAVLSNVNIMIRGFATDAEMNENGDCVSYNTLISDMSKAEELSRADRTRWMNRLSPNKATYTSLIDSFCKQDRFEVAYGVLNQMILSGFFPSVVTLKDIFCGFLRTGDVRNAYDMRYEINERFGYRWMDNRLDDDTFSLYLQGVSDEVNYPSLMNAYFDEGNWEYAQELFYDMKRLDKLLRPDSSIRAYWLPEDVLYSVFINGLDNKARTTKIKKELLWFSYRRCLYLDRPILEYHRTLAENCSDDEFKSLVELVEGLCSTGLENAYDTILKSIDKPKGIDDGIVYNLFIIEHCQFHNNNIDEAYNMYKEMVHYGFACHMFTVFALIQTLRRNNMVDELRWMIQNVLRSCNLNDSEILKFVNEFNPERPTSEVLFEVLAEKVKDGPFL